MSVSRFTSDPTHQQNIHEVQLNHLQQKYIHFNKNHNSKGPHWVFQKFMRTSYHFLQKCWNLAVPKIIRGNSSQYDTLENLWKEYYDEPVPLSVQRESLEKTFCSQINGAILILGLCYTEKNFRSIKCIVDRIDHQSEQSQIKTIVFPISIEGKQFKEEFQPKIQYKKDSLLILHKNIFNQLVVLNQVSTEQLFELSSFFHILKRQTEIETEVKNSTIDNSKQNISIETGSSTKISIKIKCTKEDKSNSKAKPEL